MNASQTQIVRDYLRRYALAYALGLLIHLLTAIASAFSQEVPLAGLTFGSAFILGIEFVRGGNTTARTLLAKPITASQLAHVWRFVAFTLPVIAYFLVLLVGVLLGKLMGGERVSMESFVLLALLQTGMLGMFFFALTGLQTSPAQAQSFGEKCSNLVFGLLWGFSVPVAMFTPKMQVTSLADMRLPHLIAWGFLLVVTIAGWFRAETLVARRTVRRNVRVRPSRASRAKDAMPWRQFGGLRYFMKLFGTAIILMFMAMLLVTHFGTNLIFGGGGLKDGGFLLEGQLGMFIPIAGLISVFQIMPMIRVLRTMPKRLTALTNLLVLWPLFLIVILSLIGHGFHALVAGQDLGQPGYGLRVARGIAAGAPVLLTLPLFLRFGLSFKSIIPMMLTVSLSNGISSMTQRDLKIAPTEQWLLIVAILVLVLPLVWFLTHRVLSSEHPWRAKHFRFGVLQRAA